MAIRRPLDTNVVDITGADLASNIAISTTGNIATTGSGTLTSAGAFTASGGIANAGTITAGTLGSSVVFPAGHLIQTAHASFNGSQTIAFNDGVTDITSLSCSMTITSGNKVLILANVMAGWSQDGYSAIYVTNASNTIILQNSTGTGNQVNASIAVTPYSTGSSGVYLASNNSFSYLWTPGVTSITVKLRGQSTYSDSNDRLMINTMYDSGNATHIVKGTSGLTIFEVQA